MNDNVRDLAPIEKAAIAKVGEIGALVAWWDAVVADPNGTPTKVLPSGKMIFTGISVEEAERATGFSREQINRWRIMLRGDFVDYLITKMKRTLGMSR